jgi:hypothetical protein
MTPVPPPPKVNPSAIALGAQAANIVALKHQEEARKALGIAVTDLIGMRKMPAPAGMKKVYHSPDLGQRQGAKETARRRRQLERAKSGNARKPD